MQMCAATASCVQECTFENSKDVDNCVLCGADSPVAAKLIRVSSSLLQSQAPTPPACALLFCDLCALCTLYPLRALHRQHCF